MGYPPSIREICAAVGLKSPSSVHTYLKELEQGGYILPTERKKRAIRLAQNEADKQTYEGPRLLKKEESMERDEKLLSLPTIQVPLLGRVTAGLPILAMEEVEDYISFFSPLRKGDDLFALRVVGESMKNAGILDDDIIVVERAQTALNGDIVVAMLDEEATVKRYYKHGDEITLMPENEAFSPIVGKNISVLGKVVANLRFYSGFSLY